MAESKIAGDTLSADELTSLNADFETAPASTVIRWAVDTFGADLVLAASFEDVVLIDLATELGARHRGDLPRHRGTLPRDPRLRGHRARPLRAQPDGDQAGSRGGGPPLRQRAVLPVPQGGPPAPRRAGQSGLADRAQARRRPDPGRRAHRQLGRRLRAGQGQPPGHVDQRRHHVVPGRPPAPAAPAVVPGLPLHRLRPHHPSGGRGRGPPGRPLGRTRQDPSAGCTLRSCRATSTTPTGWSSAGASVA